MSEDYISVRRYLGPPLISFWDWRDHGDVISWDNTSTTLVFREELYVLLSRLAPRGLPPLGAVLLILAALRSHWPERKAERDYLHILKDTDDQQSNSETIDSLFSRLNTVFELFHTELPQSEQKAELLAMVFETCSHRTSPIEAAGILRVLEEERLPSMYRPRGRQPSAPAFLENAYCLLEQFRSLDLTSFSLRSKTGLDSLVSSPDISLKVRSPYSSFLSDLARDPQFSGLSNLSKSVMAAIALPRSIHKKEGLTTGGFSDISSTGTLDRLLISELAYDQETLAVKVAMNEALYLRRETTSEEKDQRFAILVDNGLRLWGIPRVYATAVGLALSQSCANRGTVKTYNPGPHSFHEIELTTREGLINHLETLQHHRHPGQVFTNFIEHFTFDDEPCECILITDKKVFQDSRFQQELVNVPDEVFFSIITVDRSGELVLYKRTSHSMKIVQTALLEVDHILNDQTSPSQQKNRPLISVGNETPVISRLPFFPLRLPCNDVSMKNSIIITDWGVLTLTGDGRLLCWLHSGTGPLQLSETFPPGDIIWFTSDVSDGQIYLILKTSGPFYSLVILQKSDLSLKQQMIENVTEELVSCIFQDTILLLIGQKNIYCFELLSGLIIFQQKIPGNFVHDSDGFFRSDEQWFLVCYDGISLVFDTVNQPHDMGDDKALHVFRCRGIDGPIALTQRGKLFYFSEKRSVSLTQNPQLRVTEILKLHGGYNIVVRLENNSREQQESLYLGVDVQTAGVCSVDEVEHYQHHMFEMASREYISSKTLLTDFSSVYLHSSGHLTLADPYGSHFAMTPDQRRDKIFLAKFSPDHVRSGKLYAFDLLKTDQSRYSLHKAQWSDGSYALLDSRGLLHLQSSDTSIPQITLILFQADVSGWCSNGDFFGPEYFIAPHQGKSPIMIYETVFVPFLRRLR